MCCTQWPEVPEEPFILKLDRRVFTGLLIDPQQLSKVLAELCVRVQNSNLSLLIATFQGLTELTATPSKGSGWSNLSDTGSCWQHSKGSFQFNAILH